MSSWSVHVQLDLETCPYPRTYKGQEAERPYGLEKLILKLDAVEESGLVPRVRSYLVGWQDSSRNRHTVRDDFNSIPLEIFTRYGGMMYCSLPEWYSWLHWVPAYVLMVKVGGRTLTFKDPEDAARQMTDLQIGLGVDNPYLLGVELERTWSRREQIPR